MATFEVWYEETYTFKAWFEADSAEEASELINQVEFAELDINALPKFVSKDKGYTLTFGDLIEEAK